MLHNLELKCALLLRKRESMLGELERLKGVKGNSQTDELSERQLAKTQSDLISHLEGELRELDSKKSHIRAAMAEQQRERE